MKRYLILAGIGFVACSLLNIAEWFDYGIPWGEQKCWMQYVYFPLSGAYIVSFPAVLRDILSRQRIWADPRVRLLGVAIIGASIGLFLLGWIAIEAPKGIPNLRLDQFERFPDDVGTKPAWLQARDLMLKGELLGTCHMILENWLEYASVSAALAMVGIWVYDTLKPHWTALTVWTSNSRASVRKPFD